MSLIDAYIDYIGRQKRYSERTCQVYSAVLKEFCDFYKDENLLEMLQLQTLRAYQVHLLEERKLNARSVNLHISVLSGFCSYLLRQGHIKSNPVKLLTRPRQAKRLPVFYKEDAMQHYLQSDNALARGDFNLNLETEEERRDTYWLCLRRIIVCLLYSTGIRRAELIGLRRKDLDFSRAKIHVLGKGDKMREIPLVPQCIQEISLYLQAREKLVREVKSDSLLLRYSGENLYPVLVDRAVKEELGAQGKEFSGRKSPHVLRHSLATGLLEQGAELNSIKEVLGHANLAATQVYTHSSPAQLKKIYQAAHPRAGKKTPEKQ